MKNIKNYNDELAKYLDEVKVHNKYFKNSSQWLREHNTISLSKAKSNYTQKYMFDCLDKSFQSYSKYKITFIKKYLENVA